MKQLIKGILTLLGALIVSCVLIPLQTVYSFFYALYLCFFNDYSVKPMFRYIWKVIDGFCGAIGHILESTAISLDYVWNVQGELLEDVITAEDETSFGEKNVTVSASVGELEYHDKLNARGKFLSWLLNVVFNEKRHGFYAYRWRLVKEEFKRNIERYRK